jgi:hypothetical protein
MVNGAKLAKYNVIVTTNKVLHNYIKLQNIRYNQWIIGLQSAKRFLYKLLWCSTDVL